MPNLEVHLTNYTKVCVELRSICDNMKEYELEKNIIRDEYKETLLDDKEFEVLRYSYTPDGKRYLESLSPDMKRDVLAERRDLENKMNRIINDCIDVIFALRTEQYNNLQTQRDVLQKRKNYILQAINKFGSFDMVVNGIRYTQVVDRNKTTYTKKNFITAFVGSEPHHKWKCVTEFEHDWKRYFKKDSKTFTCVPIEESRKRARDDRDDRDGNGDDCENHLKKRP